MSIREKIEAGLPRVAIIFERDDKGLESFSWGAAGTIPTFTLVGALVQAASDLCTGEFIPDSDTGDPSQPLMFVVFWDAVEAETTYYNHHDIPTEALVGMIEMVKLQLLSNTMVNNRVPQSKLLGPDGKPMR